jgi:hypothetical protein
LVGRLRKQGVLHPPALGAHGPVFTLHCRHAASPLRETFAVPGISPARLAQRYETLRTHSSM